MDIKSIKTLVDWTREAHRDLAQGMQWAAKNHENERASELLEYLAGHEARIAKIIAGYEAQADEKTLDTLDYDHNLEPDVDEDRRSGRAYVDMDYDSIVADVMAIHNQIQEVYKYFAGRIGIPEEGELLGMILDTETNETMHIAHQANRGWDM